MADNYYYNYCVDFHYWGAANGKGGYLFNVKAPDPETAVTLALARLQKEYPYGRCTLQRIDVKETNYYIEKELPL